MDKIWNAIENDGYQKYDAFVSLIKDTLSPNDNEKAYQIENEVNAFMTEMFKKLEEKYS